MMPCTLSCHVSTEDSEFKQARAERRMVALNKKRIAYKQALEAKQAGSRNKRTPCVLGGRAPAMAPVPHGAARAMTRICLAKGLVDASEDLPAISMGRSGRWKPCLRKPSVARLLNPHESQRDRENFAACSKTQTVCIAPPKICTDSLFDIIDAMSTDCSVCSLNGETSSADVSAQSSSDSETLEESKARAEAQLQAQRELIAQLKRESALAKERAEQEAFLIKKKAISDAVSIRKSADEASAKAAVALEMQLKAAEEAKRQAEELTRQAPKAAALKRGKALEQQTARKHKKEAEQKKKLCEQKERELSDARRYIADAKAEAAAEAARVRAEAYAMKEQIKQDAETEAATILAVAQSVAVDQASPCDVPVLASPLFTADSTGVPLTDDTDRSIFTDEQDWELVPRINCEVCNDDDGFVEVHEDPLVLIV
jgi:hypothetical protein